jgi:hypothetical protein
MPLDSCHPVATAHSLRERLVGQPHSPSARPTYVIRVVAALLTLVVATVGCAADGSPSPGEPLAHANSMIRTPTPAAPAPRMIVPAVVGEEPASARDIVRARGLRARVFQSVGAACLAEGVVISQQPGPGQRVKTGSRVTLIVVPHGPGQCGRDLPPAPEELQDVGRLFVVFARGAESGPDGIPADTPVQFYIGGRLATVVPSTRLSDRQVWHGCPGEFGYAGRVCPVSLLEPFVEYPGPIAMTTLGPAHSCVHGWKLPAELSVYRSVTLTPDEDRDCTSYFAVELFVNDVRQVVAINLVMSEPSSIPQSSASGAVDSA